MLTNPAAFRTAAILEYSGDDDGDNMGFLNMLAGPDEDAPGAEKLKRKNTRPSILKRTSTTSSVGSTASDFDFVTMDKSRNMLKLSNKQSIWPVAVVTFIFFLWGFAYGLLAVLNGEFSTVAKFTSGEGLGLHAAYYAGYFVGPPTLGRFILRRYGFKATMIVGLCVYGCGTLVFWPSAVLRKYAAFIISNFIVAFGLSCLELAANPYTALCGPLEYAEVRLNLSQAFQAVGSVVSPLLAQRVLFRNVTNNASSLVDTQWAYLGISLFVWVLAVVFYYIPLPEATDEQMEEQADKRSAVYRRRIGKARIVWVTLALGVFSQWCYVGAQEAVGGGTEALTDYLKPKSDPLSAPSYHAIAHTLFAVGRFLGAFFNYLVKPRWILLACFVAVSILSGLQMTESGYSGITVNQLLFFFEGSIFPIVFAISMRGMGNRTKDASVLMTAAISGGAVVPVIQWAVQNSKGMKYSYSVMAAFFALGTIFPIYLNLLPAAKNQVDPVHETRNRRRRNRAQLRRDSNRSNMSTSATNQFGLAGIVARRKKHKADEGDVQHVERSDAPSNPASQEEGFQWESLSVPDPVQLKEPQGHVGELPPYHSSSKSDKILGKGKRGKEKSSKEQDEDDIQPSPVDNNLALESQWTDEDDARDDYHQMLRGL